VRWARYAWLVIPVAGLGELAAHFYFARRAPTPGEWQGARSALVELKKPGDLVVIAPDWGDPLARMAFGEELMPLRDVARADESAYARAVEVSVLGRDAPELAGWRITDQRTSGRFRFRVFENPAPARVSFDFVERLGPNGVRVVEKTAAAELDCAWNPKARVETGSLPGPPTFPPQRFACQGGQQFFVGVTIIDDQRYRPRRCIWAHPTPHGPLVIRFDAVPLGASIRGHAGLPWLIMRDGLGPPVELEVRAGGRSLGTFVHRDQDGWSGFEFPTGQPGAIAAVEFEVRSTSTRERHFCFHADTR
jgi:hypothetical protein